MRNFPFCGRLSDKYKKKYVLHNRKITRDKTFPKNVDKKVNIAKADVVVRLICKHEQSNDVQKLD